MIYMDFLTYEDYLKSAKMIIAHERETRPLVEQEQINDLKKIGFDIVEDIKEGKSDIILNDKMVSLKRLDIGASSLISNQFKTSCLDDDYLKKYEWFYDEVIKHNLRMLSEVFSFQEVGHFVHYLTYAGHINGREALPAQKILLSGRLKNRNNTYIIISIDINDREGLKKLYHCLKIEFTKNKGLGLRINNSELFNQFNVNKRQLQHLGYKIIYGTL